VLIFTSSATKYHRTCQSSSYHYIICYAESAENKNHKKNSSDATDSETIHCKFLYSVTAIVLQIALQQTVSHGGSGDRKCMLGSMRECEFSGQSDAMCWKTEESVVLRCSAVNVDE